MGKSSTPGCLHKILQWLTLIVGAFIAIFGILGIINGVGGGGLSIMLCFCTFFGILLVLVTAFSTDMIQYFGFLNNYFGTGLFLIFLALLAVSGGGNADLANIIFWIAIISGCIMIVIHFISGESPERGDLC